MSVRSVPRPGTSGSTPDYGGSFRFQGDVDAVMKSDASLIGNEFASVVAALSDGTYEYYSKGSKKGPFRPCFMDDPQFNAPLRYAHIDYAYEAQSKEIAKDWARGGKRFSTEPRLAKLPDDDSGPSKPAEFPHVFEKGQMVYIRKAPYRPFERAHIYNKPVERKVEGVALASKWSTTLNPMTYRMPDPWSKFAKDNNRYIRSPTPQFKSRSKRFATDKSSVMAEMQERSLDAETQPSVDTRPYTPFPSLDFLLSDKDGQQSIIDQVFHNESRVTR